MPRSPHVIVIGLGAMGSAVLDQLALRKVPVLGIDRYAPPHDQGSSHGETRITRQAIGEGAVYTPFVLRAHEIWRELEAFTGETLFRACGFMAIDSAGGQGALHGKGAFLARTEAVARSHGIAHEILDPGEAMHRFPAFRIPEDARVYFEPGGGLVHPERAIAAQLGRARANGASVWTHTPVSEVRPSGSGVEVRTARETVRANHVVLASGGWLPGLLPAVSPSVTLPVRLLRQTLHWFAPEGSPPSSPPYSSMSSPALTPPHFPAFIWSTGTDSADGIYGFPQLEEGTAGVKIACEQYEDVAPTPDEINRAADPAEGATLFSERVAPRFRGISRRVVRSAVCFYTQTPDGDFIVGPHPAAPNVHLVSACSGHGFKHAPAVGELVADQILTGRGTPPEFSPLRFM
jgi:sarcosine oxidase